MIPVRKLIQVFHSMLGWPYVTPGTSNAKGIDCSGAFVYAYRQFGERIYHGSNRIARIYCRDMQRVTAATRLVPGMAIFKSRADLSRMKAEYKPGGAYYDPKLPEDFYHIGLVASVDPLQIINATPPKVRIDDRLSRWQWAGYLKAVDYTAAGPEPDETCAQVTAENGSTVNLRQKPSLKAVILARVPLGQRVAVREKTSPEWWKVAYLQFTGYMMRKFLKTEERENS